jgi:hypothetical protein
MQILEETETVEITTPIVAFATLLDHYYCNIYKLDTTVDIPDLSKGRDIQQRLSLCNTVIDQVRAVISASKLDLFEMSYIVSQLFDEVHRLTGDAVLNPEFPFPDMSQFYHDNMMVFLGHTKGVIRKELVSIDTPNDTIN